MEEIKKPRNDFVDRSSWLVVAGIIEILLGGSCGLLGLLFPLISRMIGQNPATAQLVSGRGVFWNVLTLFTLTLLFVWLGVGTIRARRWARDLMLMGAWLWLITGCLPCILLPWLGQRALAELTLPDRDLLGENTFIAAVMITALVLVFLYIILPGVLVLFYSGKNVRRTFEIRDPAAGWTGRCPLTVLTGSQVLGGGAVTLLLAPVYTDKIAFWNFTIEGIYTRLIFFFSALILAYLTWAIYKMKLHAWWINFFVAIFVLAWFVPTCWNFDLAGYYAKSGFLQQQGQLIDTRDLPGAGTLSVVGGVLGVFWMGFLILIKKHFKPRA